MRYENYQKRISKVANVLRVLLLKWQLFLLLFSAAVVVIFAFVFLKGSIISVNCSPVSVYGEGLECNAIALFSKTQIEYLNSDGEWTNKTPVMPGEYQARAVGKGFFEKKASKIFNITIQKRSISVHSLDGTVNYGELPDLTADLAYNDILHCDAFETESIIAKDGAALFLPMTPTISAIQIYNAAGTDVTSAYDIITEREELLIIPREITVTVESASKIYDGNSFSFDGYELTQGTLSQGDSLFAYFTKSIVQAGSVENTPHLVLINERGIDVTPCYNIHIVAGTLTVEKRPLILKTGTGEFQYDGLPHGIFDCEVSSATPLVPGHSVSVFWGMKTDAGEYANIPSVVNVAAENGINATPNYSVFFEAGTLKITPLPITISTSDGKVTYRGKAYMFGYFGFKIQQGKLLEGHSIVDYHSGTAVDVGIYENDTEVIIYDITSNAKNKDVTQNYDITYIRGTVEIEKLPITIETSSDKWIYDGLSHYSAQVATSATLGFDDKIIVTENTSVIDVGTYTNKLSVKIVRVLAEQSDSTDGENTTPDTNETYIDTTHNYAISFVYGTLVVSKRSVTLKPADATKVYDAAPLTSSALQTSQASKNNLINGHTVYGVQTTGALTDVGTITNYIIPTSVIIQSAKGEDVTANYDLTYSVGLLTVKPREILIQTGSATKDYDGTPLTDTTFTVLQNNAYGLVKGHVLEVENIGSLTRAGKTENFCSLNETKIYSENGKDVTQNYLIKYSFGILEVRGSINGEQNNAANESGKIGSFKQDLTADTSSHSLLSVKDERNGYIYLRLKSFGGYAGNEWYEATEYSELIQGVYSANYLTALAIGQSTRNLTVRLQNPLSLLPYYTSVYFGAQKPNGYITQTSDVFYNTTAAFGDQSLYTVSYKDYDYSSALVLPEQYTEYEQAYRAFVYSQYLNLDNETRTYLEGIIGTQKFFDKDLETILKVSKYVQNCAKYNVDYNQALDSEANVAIAFLETYGEGISQHFATVLTLLYRAMGIPARYTVGYVTPTQKNQWVEVDKTQVHAWVEVYIDGVGWIEIEATGGSTFGLNASGGREVKQTVTVKPIYRCKQFDGLPLSSSMIEYDPILAELGAKGYYWSFKISGSIDTVGRAEIIPTAFILYDPYGNDVTDQYNIVYESGVLDVFEPDAVIIKISLGELQKYYDGTPLSFGITDYDISSTVSLAGIEIDVHISQTDVGYITLSELNENVAKYVSITVDKAASNIRPDQKIIVYFSQRAYSVLAAKPILQVDARPITVVASSASKFYDGTPLQSDAYYINGGVLCQGHRIEVRINGTIHNPGHKENEVMGVVILNELGENITFNYAVTTQNGVLMVYNNLS